MQLEEKGRKISFPRTSQATIHTNKILNNHQPNQLCNFLLPSHPPYTLFSFHNEPLPEDNIHTHFGETVRGELYRAL